MTTYMKQECCVRWNGTESDIFRVSNGVRQGAVASPTLFCVYIDELFHLLEQSGYGCRIENLYYGVFGYADDCVLLSPDRGGLQEMIKICEDYFSDHGIKISTNEDPKKTKTKCLMVKNKNNNNPADIFLYGVALP